jgi:Low affinity iron permease
MGIHTGAGQRSTMGSNRAKISLLRHLAAGHQYRNYGSNFSDSFPHSKHPEPGCTRLHLKLDEVIRAIRSAHNEMISIEQLSEAELQELTERYQRLREECEARRKPQEH